MTKVQGWIFTFIHTAGSIGLIILLSLLTGCLDEDLKPGEKNEVDPLKIVNEIVTRSTTPDQLRAGDTVWMGHYARTFTNPFFIIAQDTYEILKKEEFKEDTEDGPIYYNQYDIKHSNFDGDGNIIQIREGQCRLILSPLLGWYPECKIALPPFQDNFYILSDSDPSAFSGFSYITPFIKQMDNTQRKTYFYNLSVNTQMISLPKKMVEAGKCFGHKDCKVNGTIIEFDLEVDKQVSSRQHYKVTLTNELPYLGSNLETCLTYQATIDGQPAIIEECFRVLDFNIGHE